MSLKTRLGNLGNVLDEDASQCDLLQLESPVLSTAEFEAMRATMGDAACVVDCTFPVADGEAGLRAALERIRREAEEGVRAGCTHVILTDEAIGPGARADPDDPGHRRRAHASGAPVAAHLHQPERARGRVPGRALLRRADRRRRHHGERLSGAGEHRRPPPPRPVRRHDAEGGRRPLQEGGRQGPAEDHVQDGHLGHLLLSRRLQFRGDRPVARAGGRVLPRHAVAHFRHRPVRHRAQGCWTCTAPPGTPTWSRCRSAASTSCAGAARRTPSTAG